MAKTGPSMYGNTKPASPPPKMAPAKQKPAPKKGTMKMTGSMNPSISAKR